MTSTEVSQPTTTDLPSGDPVPSVPAAPTPSAKPFPLKALLAATPSNIDAFLAHLQRCLSTPSGIDTVALFLCYSSRFIGSLLESATRPAIQRSVNQLLALAANLPPSTTILFTSRKVFPSFSTQALLLLSSRLKALSALLSDARTFLRLWGLLGMYFWGRGLILRLIAARKARIEGDESAPKIDKVETSVAVTQLLACIIFQSLENGAYLAQKGVLGWEPKSIGNAYRWSARFWGAYVGIELGRLAYDAHKRSKRTTAEKLSGDKTVAELQKEESEWTDTWRKNLARQMAWFPLTIHWGLEQGLFSEMTVGAIASIPGMVQMRDLWYKTAAA